MDLLPILDPHWVPLAEGVEVTAWPLRLTDGSLLLGVSGEEAEAYAAMVGGELVSAAEEDACTMAAALVLQPITHWPIETSPGPAGQSLLVLTQLQQRGGCGEDQILAGACKVWTRDKGRPGRSSTYGWPVPKSECGTVQLANAWHLVWKKKTIPAWPSKTGIPYYMLQGLSDFHVREDHADRYSQGVRVRRAAR